MLRDLEIEAIIAHAEDPSVRRLLRSWSQLDEDYRAAIIDATERLLEILALALVDSDRDVDDSNHPTPYH